MCVSGNNRRPNSKPYVQGWTDKRTFFLKVRRLSEMFALKIACQLSNYIFRYLKPKRLFSKKMGLLATVATVKYGVMYVFIGFTTLNFSDFY